MFYGPGHVPDLVGGDVGEWFPAVAAAMIPSWPPGQSGCQETGPVWHWGLDLMDSVVFLCQAG